MELRQYPRYIVDFQLKLFPEGGFEGEPFGYGRIFNLCEYGCKAKSETVFPTGRHLTIEIADPYQNTPVQVQVAVVRWAMEYDLGLEFLKMEAVDRKRLDQIIQGLEQESSHDPELSQW